MKRYVMEGIGTFFLTLAISLTGHPIAIGLMLMAMIYVGGHVSGGHYNPAVSLVMFLEKSLSLHGLFRYWAAQSAGATAALFLFMMITNNMFVPEMASGTSTFAAMAIEALFVLVLCWVVLVMLMSNNYKASSIHHGFIIGLTLTAIAFIGGLFNPAIAVGSIICNVIKVGTMADMPNIMVYVVAPLAGGLAASYLFNASHSDRLK
jgi:aquaporin Z